MSTQLVRGVLAPVGLAAFFLGCSSGGGGGGSSLVVSGTVQSPGGGAIGLLATRSPKRVALGSPLVPLLGGLLPVPDGTSVELVRLDALGSVTESLGTTTTTGGLYSFDLTSLALELASDLAVHAGSGATRLRALATAASLDVDPTSEAVLGLMLQGGGLDSYTLDEANDLTSAVRLLTATGGLQAGADVPSTVDLIEQAVLADPSLAAFFAAAAAPGQTTEGPGDVGDFFPGTAGDTWSLSGTLSIDRGAPVPFENARRVLAVDANGVQTVEEAHPLGVNDAFRELLEETSTALVNHGNDDPEDPLTPLVVPYDEVAFPLRAGDVVEQFDVTGLSLGLDLDFDGTDETVAARSQRTTGGFEDVSVPAGEFSGCAVLEHEADTTLFFSTGPRGTATLSRREWYAPGFGLVRAETTITTSVPGQSETEELVEELVAYQVGTVGHGILPPVVLASGHADETVRPSVACDGTNYLIAFSRDTGTRGVPHAELMGALVGPTGLVLEEFLILDVGGEPRFRPGVAFDGTNYLVVVQPAFPGSGGDGVLGVRVTPQGDVLDPVGFEISSISGPSFDATLAFDGTQYTVVWNGGATMFGAHVAPDGTVGPEFVVQAGINAAQLPEIVLGVGHFLVAWSEQPQGNNDVRGTRLSTTGVVLDPGGFDIAVTQLFETCGGLSFDGTRYVVVWDEQDGTLPGSHILAERRELDGTPSDAAPIPITTMGPSGGSSPTVAFDGTNHLVVWSVASFDPGDGIFARRLALDGTLVDGPASSPGLQVGLPEGFGARLIRPSSVRGLKNVLATWIVDIQPRGIAGSLVYPF